MRKIVFMLGVLVLAAPGLQHMFAQSAPGMSQVELYNTFLKLRTGDSLAVRQANEAAVTYLRLYTATTDSIVRSARTDVDKASAESNAKIIQYLRSWTSAYRIAVYVHDIGVSAESKDFAKAFALGRSALNESPDDVRIILALVRAGFASVSAQPTGNPLAVETGTYAQRALELFDQGRVPGAWAPYMDRRDATGFLWYAIGAAKADATPAEAAQAFLMAAQTKSASQSDPQLFIRLAQLYEKQQITPLAAEYTRSFPPNTPVQPSAVGRMNEMLGKVNAAIDRVIDAYARATVLSAADHRFDAAHEQVNKLLVFYYKSRHGNSETGLPELLASVLLAPLPPSGF